MMNPFVRRALPGALILALAAPAAAKTVESRLHPSAVHASSFLSNERNRFVENHHPNYVVDDDPATAWIEAGTTSGAGEWLRLAVNAGDTTRVRLRVRNGCQASKDAWAAHARAKTVTVRLLPGTLEREVELADKLGWQEIVVDAPVESLDEIELAVRSVYDGAKYQDLCISDIQVLASGSDLADAGYQKFNRERLARWRAKRVAAAKAFAATKSPLYPSYAIQWTENQSDSRTALERAASDPVFAKEWKAALAVATELAANPQKMTRARIAPASADKLVEVDGAVIMRIAEVFYGYSEEGASLKLPALGTRSALFASELRIADVKDKLTTEDFAMTTGRCKPPVAWVWRTPSIEATAPPRVTAIAIGWCERVEQRGGWDSSRNVEIMVYDAAGRLVLVSGDGYVTGYRWTSEGGRQLLAGGRSVVPDGTADATRRELVAPVAPVAVK